MIYGIVKAQKLDLRAQAAADTIDYLTAKFSFMSADWDGLVKYAHFQQGETRFSVQLENDMISESDHLNLAKGEWQVYLHGNEYSNGDVIKRITTNIVTFTVDETGALDGEPFPEVEAGIVEQLAADIADHEERISELEVVSGVHDVQNDKGESLVEDAIATIPSEVIEIIKSYRLAYTVGEIVEMFQTKELKVNGKPVIDIYSYGTGVNYNTQIYYIDREANTEYLLYNEYGYDGRTLSTRNRAGVWSAENYTTADKTKLAGIEAGAEANTIIDVLDSDGNSVVGADRKARLPEASGDSKLVEVCKTEIGVDYSLYSPADILQMSADGVGMTYKGRLVTSVDEFDDEVILQIWRGTSLIAIFVSATAQYGMYPTRTVDYGGTFSASERAKLNGIETGAQVNLIEQIKKADGTVLPITNKGVTLPTIPEEQIQSDWEQSDSTAKDYIKHKPSIPVLPTLATVATTGDYDDLSNKPSIPQAGQISQGNTGYATGGDVYTVVGNVEAVLAELIGGD